MFDVMANLAASYEGTPSLLDDEDDDMSLVEHVSKSIQLGSEEQGMLVAARKL